MGKRPETRNLESHEWSTSPGISHLDQACPNFPRFVVYDPGSKFLWDSLNGGLVNGASGTCPRLPLIACNYRQFATKVSFTKGPKRLQMCIIKDDCAHVTESGLKPPI